MGGELMQVLIEDGYVVSYATFGGFVNGIEIQEPDNLQHFEDNFEAYKIVDNKLVYDEEKGKEISAEKAKFELRERRQTECFDVIDRSKLWYDTLTEEQLSELKKWYLDWLDVTETGIIPIRPNWL
jgi:hypothetical protein